MTIAMERGAGLTTAARVEALSRGLRGLTLPAGATVLVVTCAGHDTDHLVAEAAARRVSAHPHVVAPDDPGLREALLARPALVLACAEGSAAVAATRLPCRIYGDRPGMAWWRMLELARS
jgi:hypothetical protein